MDVFLGSTSICSILRTQDHNGYIATHGKRFPSVRIIIYIHNILSLLHFYMLFVIFFIYNLWHIFLHFRKNRFERSTVLAICIFTIVTIIWLFSAYFCQFILRRLLGNYNIMYNARKYVSYYSIDDSFGWFSQ